MTDQQTKHTRKIIYVALGAVLLLYGAVVAIAYQQHPVNAFILVAGFILFVLPALSIIISGLQGDLNGA